MHGDSHIFELANIGGTNTKCSLVTKLFDRTHAEKIRFKMWAERLEIWAKLVVYWISFWYYCCWNIASILYQCIRISTTERYVVWNNVSLPEVQ